MKLAAILLFITGMQVSAHGYSQTISFSGKNVPLQTVFASIEKQTGLSFFFNYSLIKDSRPVTLNIQNVPLEDALNEVLKGQGLDFYKTGKTIFIIGKKSEQLMPGTAMLSLTTARQVDVKGQVTNQQGEPLAGASVTLKSGTRSTMTDEKGIFQLKNVLEGTKLQISFTGYQRVEVTVEGSNMILIELRLANNTLDEMQVIAYGQTTQRYSVGNVTTIKGDDIAKQPVGNALLALEGRVPGLVVTPTTGLSGSGVTIRVEGQNSLLNGSDPLYVIDGVPYTSQLLSGMGGILGGSGGVVNGLYTGAGNPLSYLNPMDIESISVLKDADATAIYGSRASNGAILITTKKGKQGHSSFDVSAQQGIGHVNRTLKLMNTQQYLTMRHEALTNDGISSPKMTDYDINGFWDTTRYTDWQKVLIGGTSHYTNLSANTSGGNANVQYLIGATYHRETTVFPGDFADQKGSIHFSLTSTSENQKFHLQLSGNYLVDNNQLPGRDFTFLSSSLAPDAPALYNKDGSLNWMLNSNGSSTWSNPLASNFNRYFNKVNNLISSILLSYQILPGLYIKSNFGYTNLQQNEIQIYPLIAISPQNRVFNQGSANYGNSSIVSWIVEPQLNYSHSIGKGKVDVLLGSTIQQNNNDLQQLYGYGYNSDLVLKNLAAASSITAGTPISSIYKYNALFGRINILLRDRYLVDLTARRDGSSRFGPQNQFHDFGAIGVGWIFSQTKMFQKNINWISYGKIRASYGTTGNDQIGDYRFLALYNPTSQSIPYQGSTGLVTAGLSNPYLQWEETKKFQLGIDLGLFKDRVLLNAAFYRNRSSNQLLNYHLPINTGFNNVTENFPATIQNSGLELSINTVNVKSNKFNWSTSFNMTVPRNKLVSFPGLSSSTYSSFLTVGKPVIGLVPLYHYAGVDPSKGVYDFYDRKGNITSTPGIQDYTDTINTAPTFIGGIENKLGFMGFELHILFQYVKQKGPNNNYISTKPIPGAYNSNQSISLLNRWQKQSDQAVYQKYNSTSSLLLQLIDVSVSNAAYSNASFIRLTNLSLSWQVPKNIEQKLHLSDFKILAQGQNLITISPVKNVLNPESESSNALPLLREFVIGVQIKL